MRAELLIALILVQRLAELAWARRNMRHLIARGAVEHGARHYPLLIVLHSLWLGVMAALSVGLTVPWPWVAAFLLLQALRLWTIATLGQRWSTRVLVLPQAPLVAQGPFRFVRHPNYLIVACELALIPLALGAPWTALIFTLLNAGVMAIRIPCEEAALRMGGPEKTGPP